MRILILGGDGMLGHQLVDSWRHRHDVHLSLHAPAASYRGAFDELGGAVHYGVEARDPAALERLVGTIEPNAVVNAIGIVKQCERARDPIVSIEINALLPHRLAAICARSNARLVHLSTDCVFAGTRSMYGEADLPDIDDLYGRSKVLGEVIAPNAITLRTSMVGLELSRKHGLVEWFLAQTRSIKGYRKAIFGGLTTLELARVIERLLVKHPHMHGLYHVSSDPIDKLTLLVKLRDALRRDLEITPDDELVCDRSLDSTRFKTETGYVPPSWDVMLDELTQQIKERRR
jgi:dTDP-4-dehydrorhamnose reductase